MKTSLCLGFAASLLLAACGQKSDQPPASTNGATSGSSPLTAPVDYLKAVAKDQQSAVKTIDTTSVNAAIQQFNVAEGRNPKDLNELVEKHYLAQIPTPPYGTKLVYDPAAGTVSVVKQ